jgi:GH18 family chitinase
MTPETAVDFSVIGYFPDYRSFDLEWGRHLTDIIYFSAEPRADGTLDAGRLDERVLNQMHRLQGLDRVQLLVSVGGWGRSAQFAEMTADSERRKKFVENLSEYVHVNKLNGVDFDWEFPQNAFEFQNYIHLLEEAKADFGPKGLIVSVALPPDSDFPLKDFAVVDRIHIMSYDRHPFHSTYEQAVEDLQKFMETGIPRSKLILGVPFYGREVTAPYNEAAYSDIVAAYHPAPGVDLANGIFFNGIETIRRKTCLAMNEHVGGVMIWELAQDTKDLTSLLNSIRQTVVHGCGRRQNRWRLSVGQPPRAVVD